MSLNARPMEASRQSSVTWQQGTAGASMTVALKLRGVKLEADPDVVRPFTIQGA